MSDENRPKRIWVYCQRPGVYGVAGCECGNEDPEWSEYQGMLWCEPCKKDFIPEHNGIFDGPIPISICNMLGIYFDRYDLETNTIIRQE